MSLLDLLNPPQKEATCHVDGPLLVLAGAGSGKTRVLTHRIAYLMSLGISPWNILAVTFTNKAAKEMRHRVVDLAGPNTKSVWLRTFHSACVRILRKDIELLGYDKGFNIYDSEDQQRLLKAILVDNEWMPKEIDGNQVRPGTVVKRYLRLFEQAKLVPRRFDEICSYIQENGDYINNPKVEPEDVFVAYHQRLKKANAIDFNDIINYTVHLWEDHPKVLQYWQDKFKYIMVDEYQDTNPAQYRLLKLLSRKYNNIMVVGDDDQSIYGFRGADIESVNNFNRDYHPKVIRLEQNYRSTGNIIAAANSVIVNNPNRMVKKMWTSAKDGELIDTIEPLDKNGFYDERWEAKEICKKISTYLDSGYQLSDMAIIYRTNQSALTFEKFIRENRFDYEMIGSFKFYDRQEVKDVLSYMKLLINPYDAVSFERAITTPKRGIGPKALKGIVDLALQNDESFIVAAYQWGNQKTANMRKTAMNFAQMISDVHAFAQNASPKAIILELLDKSGYQAALKSEMDLCKADLAFLEQKGRSFAKNDAGKSITRLETLEALEKLQQRWDNIEQLIEEMENYYEGLEESEQNLSDWLYGYLDFVALNSAADKEDGRDRNSITLLTAHLAKGLEFPIVFVTGLWEGNFPHFRSLQEMKGLEEERRLAYVALTRAKECLIISRPGQVPSGGQNGFVKAEVSTFWEEIDSDLFKVPVRKAPNLLDGFDLSSFQKSRGRYGNEEFQNPSPNISKNVELDLDSYSSIEITSIDDFQVGVEIRHPKQGLGKIVKRLETFQGISIEVEFYKSKMKVLFPPTRLNQITEIIVR